MDFNFNPPLITHDPKQMLFYANCSVMADKDGNLLFYSNGKWIASNNHQPLENGSGLNPGDQASLDGDSFVNLPQGSVAFPAPGEDGKYYLLHAPYKLFTLPFDFIGFAILYTVIDMNANNGLGNVTAKNQVIISDSLWTGKLTAVQHANGRDWWALTNKYLTNQFYKILVSPQGIAVVDTQAIGMPVDDDLGQAVFSPDGTKYAVTYGALPNDIQIFDFDRCTGELSNEVIIQHPQWFISPGLAISSNSRYLYFCATDTLYQYDLWAADIPASEEIVGVYDGHADPFPSTFFLAQLAPDNKIYISVPNGSAYLHVIEKPNKKGLACAFRQHAINLMNYNGTGLPNNPNYRLGPVDGSPCDTLGIDNVPVARFRCEQDTADYFTVSFTDLSYYEPATWSWDFGDNATSQDTSPVHTFPGDGVYAVCLSVSNLNGEHTFCKTVYIGTSTVDGDEKSKENFLLVYPNPASDAITIKLKRLLAKPAEFRLFDFMGKEMSVQSFDNGTGTYLLKLDGLPPGAYFWSLMVAAEIVQTGKLTILNKI
jgi:PKD repeat protein